MHKDLLRRGKAAARPARQGAYVEAVGGAQQAERVAAHVGQARVAADAGDGAQPDLARGVRGQQQQQRERVVDARVHVHHHLPAVQVLRNVNFAFLPSRHSPLTLSCWALTLVRRLQPDPLRPCWCRWKACDREPSRLRLAAARARPGYTRYRRLL